MSDVDWKAEVKRYEDKGETQARHVEAAIEHVDSSALSESEYWETVYTIAQQRAQMIGSAE